VEVVGLVVNRVRTWSARGEPPVGPPGPEAERWLAGALAAHGFAGDASVAAAEILAAGSRQALLAARDASVVRALAADLPLPGEAIRVVPLLDEDVHAQEGLARLATHLFGREAA
jgi:hypothetical protein